MDEIDITPFTECNFRARGGQLEDLRSYFIEDLNYFFKNEGAVFNLDTNEDHLRVTTHLLLEVEGEGEFAPRQFAVVKRVGNFEFCSHKQKYRAVGVEVYFPQLDLTQIRDNLYCLDVETLDKLYHIAFMYYMVGSLSIYKWRTFDAEIDLKLRCDLGIHHPLH